MTDTVDKVIVQSSSEGTDQATAELQGLAKAYDGVTIASQSTERSTTSVEGKFAALERRFATTAGQATQFEKIQRAVNLAVGQNPELQDRANAVLDAARVKYSQSADEVDKLSHSHAGLSAQGQAAAHSVRSAIEEIALGVPITQVATQQLGHLSFASSGPGGLTAAFKEAGGLFGGLTASAAAFVTPAVAAAGAMALISGGAIAAGLAWQSGQNEIARALTGIGRQSGATVADINAVALSVASASRLSIGQASEIATSFAATGKISRDVLQPATAATEGLARALGVDAAEAAKLLAGALADPEKGVTELDAKVGAFNATTREQIAQALRMGDVAGAQALIINGVTVATQGAIEATKSWTDSFGDLWASLKDGTSLLGGDLVKGLQLVRHDLGGAVPTAGVSKQEQFATAQQDLASLTANGVDFGGGSAQAYAEQLARLTEQVKRLKAELAAQDIAAWNAELDRAASAADNSTRALVPQIDQVHKLEQAVSDLTRAQNVLSARGAFSADYGAALTAAQNQLQLTQESKDEAARYNAAVQAIGQAWDGVTLKTALQLDQLSNQLPVAQAVTGEARMQAQYYATIAALLDQGKTAEDAQAIAAGQLALSQAQATSSVEKQVIALRDSTAMIRAQQNGTEASTAAAIAYKNAIANGADSSAAAALSSATLANYAAKAASSFQQMADAADQAAAAEEQAHRALVDQAGGQDNYAFGGNDVAKGTQYTSTSNLGAAILAGWALSRRDAASTVADRSLSNGGLDAAISGAQSTGQNSGDFGLVSWSQYGLPNPDKSSESDTLSTVKNLYDLKNAQTNDNAVKTANLQEELAWLQSRPETIARDQAIVNLYDSIKQLTTATNANTAATLNPLYSQGHGALAIGYYHAANGLDLIAQGPTSGDQIPFHAMVNGGERIQIGPASAPASNASSPAGKNIVNNNNFVFNDTKTSNARRSVRQFGQGLGQLVAAAS